MNFSHNIAFYAYRVRKYCNNYLLAQQVTSLSLTATPPPQHLMSVSVKWRCAVIAGPFHSETSHLSSFPTALQMSLCFNTSC